MMDTYFHSKKILVAGGSGFVGVNILKKLLNTGANLRATLYNKEAVIKDNSIEYIKCDLTNKEECKKAVEGIDYLFMCAAITSGAKVMATTPLVHLTPNILMNLNLLEAAYEADVKKFLFISSNTVYPLVDFPVKEDDVTNEFYKSYHIVAWMKRFTEIVCDMYSNRISSPMTTVVVRPGNLYGPYDKFDWEKSKVIPALIRRAIEKHDPFEIWGDGKDVKDFLYIEDFIDALILSMKNLDSPQPLNIASGIPVTIRDVLKVILDKTNYNNANVIYDSSKPTMIPKRLINIDKAKTDLGWFPKTNLDEGIGKTIEWYNDYYIGSSPEAKSQISL